MQQLQKKAEQKKSALRRAAIEDSIHVQVANSFEQMAFWQTEAVDRQTTYQTLTDFVERNLKTSAKSGVTGLEALNDYLTAAQSYLESLRENNIAKARLEWAVGKDL